MKLWTENYHCNIHSAAAIINEKAPDLVEHLVSLAEVFWGPDTGCIVIAVFRVSDELYAELKHKRLNPPVAVTGEPIILSGGADGVVFSLEDGQ